MLLDRLPFFESLEFPLEHAEVASVAIRQVSLLAFSNSHAALKRWRAGLSIAEPSSDSTRSARAAKLGSFASTNETLALRKNSTCPASRAVRISSGKGGSSGMKRVFYVFLF